MSEVDAGRGVAAHGAPLARAFFLTPRGSSWGDRIFQAVVYASVGLFVLAEDLVVGVLRQLVLESLQVGGAVRQPGLGAEGDGDGGGKTLSEER